MINELFHVEDTHMPLSRRCEPDKLILIDSILGQFTVKSAYFVVRKLMAREEISAEYRSPIWRLVWSARVLPRVKCFMWRLLWAILPTRDRVIQRGLNCKIIVVHVILNESTYHVFFECDFSRQVLYNICKWVILVLELGPSPMEFWVNMMIKRSRRPI